MNQPQVIMLTLASLLFQTQIGTTVQYSVPYYTFCMLLIAISDVAPLLTPVFFLNRVAAANSGNVFLEMHASCILEMHHASVSETKQMSVQAKASTTSEFAKNLLIYGVIGRPITVRKIDLESR